MSRGIMLTAEHGKVVGDAMGELQRGIENVEYASYAPELLAGGGSNKIPSSAPGAGIWRLRGPPAAPISPLHRGAKPAARRA